MDLKTYNETIDRIRENIGSELSATNSEDFLGVVGAFSELTENFSDLQKENEKLQTKNKELLETNGKLFQRIGFDKVTFDNEAKKQDEQKDEEINIEDIIDEKGELI